MARSLEGELTELRQRVRTLEQIVQGLLSRASKGTPAVRLLEVELAADFDVGDGSVSCHVIDWDGTDEVDSGATVTVYDRGYNFAGYEGNKALALWRPLKQRWEFVQMECDPTGDASDTASSTIEGEIESEFEPVGP